MSLDYYDTVYLYIINKWIPHITYANMHYVYLLQSEQNKSLYIGCTQDLKKRIEQHNAGESYHTKKHLPWKLVYFEGYRSKADAYQREKSLKLHAQGLRRLKERLRDSLRA